MSFFVDYVGLNTLVSSSLDLTSNVISYGENREIAILDHDTPVASSIWILNMETNKSIGESNHKIS